MEELNGVHKPTWRAVSLLNYISHNPEVTLQECAKNLSIPVGTLFPIIRTLVTMGYVECDESSKRYSIGLKAFLSGVSYVARSGEYGAVEGILRNLSEECNNETAHFCRLEGGNVLYLAKIDSTHSVRMYSAVGLTLPAYGTAVGKALLCDMNLEELKTLYPNGLTPLTDKTITSFEKLYEQLLEIRKTGYAYECGESNESIQCIAAPVRCNGKIDSAISVALPVYRYSDELGKKMEESLFIAASEIAKVLKYKGL